MAPATPGGGYDQTARALQKVMTEGALTRNVQVFNVPGAGGTLGLTQLVTQSQGDGGMLMVAANVMMGAIITNHSPIGLTDTRPVARLTSEYEAVVVPAESPIKTVEELIAKFKADPGGVSWAGGSAGGIDHITVALIAKAAGVAPTSINYIPYSGGGEALASILGGSVTAGINTLSEFQDQIAAGALRPLAVSAPERIAGVDAPTLKEAGLDVDTQTWRMVAAPPGVSDGDYQALVRCVTAAATSPGWKTTAADRKWTLSLLTGSDLDVFVKQQADLISGVLRDIKFVQ